MEILEIAVVGFIVLGALAYLYQTFKPKGGPGGSCGCGSVDCKVPKPQLKKVDSPKPEESSPS